MRRFFLRPAIALLIVTSSSACASTPEPETGDEARIHLVLLHTNDVHGQVQPRAATWIDRENPPLVGGLPRIAAYVKGVREGFGDGPGGVLVVDAGDFFQGTPEGLIEKGRAYTAALAEVGYDAICVGNHDLDHGFAPLRGMIADYQLPTIAANLYVEEGGERIDWVEPWRVFDFGGLRVGVVGLLTPVTPSITHEDARAIHFEDPVVSLARVCEELEGQVDWILPLTHQGVAADRALARAFPALDLIVGGHQHSYLKEGVKEGRTTILQVGSKGSAVGRADLWFDAESNELVELSYRVVDLLDEPTPEQRNARVDEICAKLVEQSEAQMEAPVGELGADLTRATHRFDSSTAGNLLTDVMRARVGAQLAIQNRGGIRRDLRAGALTRRDLFEILPFGNHLVLLEVSGEDLLTCLRAAVEGTAHSGLEVSGATVLYRPGEGGAGTLVGLEIGGEAVDPARRYTLATNSFLASGADGYDSLGTSRRLREDTLLLRELLEEHFRSASPVIPATDQRYRRVP